LNQPTQHQGLSHGHHISAWYKEVIKDKVTIKFQAYGGLLDDTMMRGDVPGQHRQVPDRELVPTIYKLTGAIQPVPVGSADLSTVQVTPDDFEASAWWRTQDAYKAGPSEQHTLADIIVMAQRRKRDTIKLDALATFAGLGGDVTTIGDRRRAPDILHLERARAEIAATGADDEDLLLHPAGHVDDAALLLPEFAQLAVGRARQRAVLQARSGRRCRTFAASRTSSCPDEYFVSPSRHRLVRLHVGQAGDGRRDADQPGEAPTFPSRSRWRARPT
jgi:hypothetical protein